MTHKEAAIARSEKANRMRELRTQGCTYEEIGKKMGVSKQRVAQLIGGEVRKHFNVVTEKGCVYPNIRKWLNENSVCVTHLTRLIYGQSHTKSIEMVRRTLGGGNCSKQMIDKILDVTGLTYEVAFEKKGVTTNDTKKIY